MLTNELRKGDWVRLWYGWDGQIMDNRKGDRRCVEVHGYFTEMGDVYAHDIVAKIAGKGGAVLDTIEHTDRQRKLRATLTGMGLR